MARAIVTFGRSWQSLAIVRSLGRQGIEVFVGEEAPFAPCFFSRYCTGSFQHPSFVNEPEAFLDFMESKIRELTPADAEPYVLLPVHKETWLFAEHRERFESLIRLPLTSYENMARVHNKGEIPRLAAQVGVLIPTTHLFESLEEVEGAAPTLKYPLFVKLREGAAGVGIKKVDTSQELTATFKQFVEGYRLGPAEFPLVQEAVPGQDYCVTLLFNRGERIACMTYRNVRSFPRETGAGSLRESVRMPAGEEAAVRLLSHLSWHGIAEVDFRWDGEASPYLIEVNPRFFGGLPQAVAANVDYPYLLFRIAAGQSVEKPTVDHSTRTESPITGLLATLEEIARDDRLLDRFRRVRSGFGEVMHGDVRDLDLRSFWEAVRSAANPKDLKAYFASMFEKHQNTINDVLQRDDPLPAMGFLYPIALMLRHGRISMGVLTGESELAEQRPRRRLRDLLRRPTWGAIVLTAALYAACLLLTNWEYSRNNVGLILAWPSRLAEWIVGDVGDPGTLIGALKQTVYQFLNLGFLYVVSALILRESRTKRRLEAGER